MAGFKLRQSGAADKVEEWTISSLTLAAGDLLELDVGAASATVSDTSTICYQRMGVCMEATTSSDTLVTVLVVNQDQLWEVESANASDATDNGDAMALTDQNTVNNSGTNSTAKEAVVVQVNAVGPTADKRITVRFTSTTSGLTHDAA